MSSDQRSGNFGVVSAVPDVLDICARSIHQCADESDLRVRRVTDAMDRHRTRNFRPCAPGSGSVRLTAKKRAIAAKVAGVAAGLRTADNAPTFRGWHNATEPIARRVEETSRRSSRPWEPTWDPLDPLAPTTVGESFDDYVVSSSLSAGVGAIGESRVASIRKTQYSDGSVEITVGTFRSDDKSASAGAGAFVKNEGFVFGVALGASALLQTGSGEAMTWRFRSKQDADTFVNLVKRARSDYAKKNYDWTDKVRDLAGLGLVHSHAPSSFWKMALAINPYPDRFTKQTSTTVDGSAELLVATSTLAGGGALTVGVRTTWDLRRGRTTVESIPSVSGSISAERSGVGSNSAGAAAKLSHRTTYETATGRVLSTEKTVEKIAEASTPGSEASAPDKQTRMTSTTTLQFRDSAGNDLPNWTESSRTGTSREVSASDGQGGFGGGLVLGMSRLYGPIARARTVSLNAPIVRSIVKGPIGKPPERPKDVSPDKIAPPAEVASLRQ